jgi:hypothetical protein
MSVVDVRSSTDRVSLFRLNSLLTLYHKVYDTSSAVLFQSFFADLKKPAICRDRGYFTEENDRFDLKQFQSDERSRLFAAKSERLARLSSAE